MAILKLPERKKGIQLTENGRKYEIDVTDLDTMREMAKLSRAAFQTMGGIVWTQTEEKQIISDCKNVIDQAFGAGSYECMAKELPDIRENAVLLLGICGQVNDIAQNTVREYVNQYRKDKNGVEDLRALLEAIIRAGQVLDNVGETEVGGE